MSNINDIVKVILEIQDLEDMMQSYQQAIVVDPMKLMKMQSQFQQMEMPLMQQDPGQMVLPQPPQLDPSQMQQDPNQDPSQQMQDPSQMQQQGM